MSVLVFSDAQTTATAAATLVAAQIIQKPGTVLGLDGTESLQPVYKSLKAMTANGLLNWRKATLVQLTELVRDDGSQPIRGHMDEALYGGLSLGEGQLLIPYGAPGKWAECCRRFENDILDRGGMDMLLTTVRPDGSLLFNGTQEDMAPITHVEMWEGEKTITAGLSTLMAARQLVVVMTGAEMAEAAREAIQGTVSTRVPASLLQLHGSAVFLLDEAAAALLV